MNSNWLKNMRKSFFVAFIALVCLTQSCINNKAQEAGKVEASAADLAPDFTLKDMDGNEVNLSDFRGKYLVVDFWGAWCVWCMRGMPAMKEYYAKYSDKVEFLGVDCNDTEETWKATIEEQKIPWKNVYNGMSKEILELYDVPGFPTKFIISPEGEVLKKVVGEDPEFYTYLDELLK